MSASVHDFQDFGKFTTPEDSRESTFGPRKRILARNPEFRSSGSRANSGFRRRNRDPAANREFGTPANLKESAFVPRISILPKLRKNRSSRSTTKKFAFAARNRILPGKPENESSGSGEKSRIAARNAVSPSSPKNELRIPWSWACEFGFPLPAQENTE